MFYNSYDFFVSYTTLVNKLWGYLHGTIRVAGMTSASCIRQSYAKIASCKWALIYLSIIQPHFDYCFQIWGCLGKRLSDKLQKLRNRAFRIITCENYDICSEDILNRVGFSNLQTRREHQLAILMYKIKHKVLATELFNRYFHQCQ